MSDPAMAPYGSWKSPITSDLIVSESIGLGQILLDGPDVYWTELRPSEGGRMAVVRRPGPDGPNEALTPAPFNARTRVHEYGGGAFTVLDGALIFANFADQRLYRLAPGAAPQPITPATALRYADLQHDRRRGRLICVREDHTAPGQEAVNTLAAIPLDRESAGEVLVSGANFYSSPRLSPDGSRLAWLSWNHPNMPWDGCDLWVAQVLAGGSLGPAQHVAGGPSESIFQPEWSPAGELYFVSDRSNWWNLYRWRDGHLRQALCPRAAEFGVPQWLFDMSTYGFESAESLLCSYTEGGRSHLARLHTGTLQLTPVETPYEHIASLQVTPGRAAFIGGRPTEPAALVRADLAPDGSAAFTTLRRSSEVRVDPGYISTPQAIEFPTEGGLTAHAFFYPPRNRDFVGPDGERPPLLVLSHGGPTGATGSTLSLGLQYWTSRGFAVVDVNYGGSAGYGREYRQRLNGQWGVVDVNDCANAAHYVAGRGLADAGRLAIRGGSAGGYTTLCALTFRDTFKAGASHFGIADLEVFAGDTHKFESRYLDSLVGPYPERKDLYAARSPIHFLERLNCALILFQGLEDKIVPPNQAEMMFEAVKARGLPVAYLPFEGEQHGFRQAHNIKRALDSELYFYSRVFGFSLADPVQPVPIENLDSN